MSKLVVCSAAERDYTESLRWYYEHSIEAARDFDAEFDRPLREISKDPERFPRCDQRYRFFLMKRFPFQIIYRTIGKDCVIIAVAHASRSPDYGHNR